MKKRILSLALALVMCLGLCVPASAELAGGDPEIANLHDIKSEKTGIASNSRTYRVSSEFTTSFDENGEENITKHSGYTAFSEKDTDSWTIFNVGEDCAMCVYLFVYKRSPNGKADYTWDGHYYMLCEDSTFKNDDNEEVEDYVYLRPGKSITFSFSEFNKNVVKIEDKGDGEYVYSLTVYTTFDDERVNTSNDSIWWKTNSWFRVDQAKVDEAKQAGSSASSKFTDVAADSPFKDAINWAVQQGITKGTTDTTFGPGNTCTVSHILTFLWRAAGQPGDSAANWAKEQGITAGDLSAPCTRAMAVEFMWKAAGSPAASKSASFTDVAARADYAQAVAWAVEKGVTSGTSATTFAPDNTCTRGQIVTFLYRASK